MLWKTHQRISKEVMARLGLWLTREEFSSLMEGAIAPDKWQDWPHHYGKSFEIGEFLKKARKSYLINDLPDAYFSLGVALHYIQDSYTTYPSSNQDAHHKWEQLIEESTSDSSFDTIRDTVESEYHRGRCCWLNQELSNNVQGRNDTLRAANLNGQKKEYDSIASPKVDFYIGFWASYTVSKSILSPRNSTDLDILLKNSMFDHIGPG
jgi:hypothetical protein